MNFYDWFFLNKNMDGTPRPVEGLFSLAHILTVTLVLLVLVGLAIFLGLKYKHNEKAINIILKVSAIIMIVLYVSRVTFGFIGSYLRGVTDPISYFKQIVNSLPLFLCDVAIFAIPVIAFTKGKVRTLLADFMAIWGIPMGVIGTYLAGNIFGRVPVFSFDGVVAILIHIVPAAVTVFLYLTNIATLERKNMVPALISFGCFLLFVLFYNYMFNLVFQGDDVNFLFFFKGDGTPFDLFKPHVPLPVYQIIVFTLYMSYMALFYLMFYWIKKKVNQHKEKEEVTKTA